MENEKFLNDPKISLPDFKAEREIHQFGKFMVYL